MLQIRCGTDEAGPANRFVAARGAFTFSSEPLEGFGGVVGGCHERRVGAGRIVAEVRRLFGCRLRERCERAELLEDACGEIRAEEAIFLAFDGNAGRAAMRGCDVPRFPARRAPPSEDLYEVRISLRLGFGRRSGGR